ncbi:tRNA (adenosine(37)-N6)-threonylcarbamoyltransferase complex ATPase subunit type 1 TsaE [Flavobacteriaceae bacterium 14752]|uniref:tRNA (adenosine(37)-N6)-threonylcarbamoyltransferase complex ATPase subunit type 1 TsaE n=1 Tax=Mesohalobacter salilacus TaxID=2491711 RepID=UPI000F64298B|nr:tRNA (adenosine(37)-N6)-threonylcarbamoyltransferase complex ATPase subunit type 1 TsaE [Flavobacteriaceae bacterium 14752]
MTYGLDNLDEVARYILNNSKSNTFLFFGEMGVGKTTLIKALVKHLGSEDNVSSPTYSLVNEYLAEGKPIYHFDFYRINSIEEVYDIGFEDYLAQDAYIIIEWPELIESLWPEKFVKMELSLVDNEKRKIEMCEVF